MRRRREPLGSPDRGAGRRVLFALIVGLLGAALLPHGARAQERDAAAMLLDIDGVIGPATAEYVEQGLERAATEGFDLVVLRMNTPGGLDASMRTIISGILASPVPVAGWVAPAGARAASAGTYILYASHVAAMVRGTNLGAATPVRIGGGGLPGLSPPEEESEEGDEDREDESPAAPGDASEAKAINDAVAYIRGLAELRGRNVEWAEKAVREAASLPSTEAAEMAVVDFLAGTIESLLEKADGRTVEVDGAETRLAVADARVVEVAPDWRIRLLSAITNPNIAFILMLIGIYGIIFELMNPGAIIPGTIGVIALIVALYGLQSLPVDYAGLALLLVGIALMVGEAFAPSFGVMGIGGIVAFALGAAFLFDSDLPGLELAWPVIAGTTAASAAILILIFGIALGSFRKPVRSGREMIVGARGQIVSWSGDTGRVHLQGEDWRAAGPEGLVPGQTIRVVALSGLTLHVEPDETGRA